jgi:hypothetical protein
MHPPQRDRSEIKHVAIFYICVLRTTFKKNPYNFPVKYRFVDNALWMEVKSYYI